MEADLSPACVEKTTADEKVSWRPLLEQVRSESSKASEVKSQEHCWDAISANASDTLTVSSFRSYSGETQRCKADIHNFYTRFRRNYVCKRIVYA